ncbi:response regulator [Motilibacter deserti]|uniref:Response regulator transcription factor n=1 Tax=Motilibacter deserti TaxID=2714956 RepID=A0ABX0GUA3_9ACTN|nr:response regulator transcription factor [Motilibacter deserti]NHC14093.1 response regulator transcription factor [Motilibacter deserti]
MDDVAELEPVGRALRVVLADDQPLVRAGLRVLIADQPDLAVVAEAGTGLEAVAAARELQPDVVLMDVRMPRLDGIEATRRILAEPTRTRVAVLTTFDDEEYVYGALRAGASGFFVKDMPLEAILDGIRVVAAGDALLAPAVTRRLIADLVDRPSRPVAAPALERVSPREREVLALVGRGLSNAEIADELVITVATAKAHVARLLTKLDARDRVQLVILAYECGLVGGPR